jgi:hypothetical protein
MVGGGSAALRRLGAVFDRWAAMAKDLSAARKNASHVRRVGNAVRLSVHVCFSKNQVMPTAFLTSPSRGPDSWPDLP